MQDDLLHKGSSLDYGAQIILIASFFNPGLNFQLHALQSRDSCTSQLVLMLRVPGSLKSQPSALQF